MRSRVPGGCTPCTAARSPIGLSALIASSATAFTFLKYAGAAYLLLGTIFTLLAALSDSAYALLAAALGNWLRVGRGPRRSLAKLSGAVYIGLGATAALSGGRPLASHR